MNLTRLALVIMTAAALMAAPQATAPAKAPAKTTAPQATSAALVDINSASADELSALPGHRQGL
jgi:DNA uptake protein ComE-like DNA-binding protein